MKCNFGPDATTKSYLKKFEYSNASEYFGMFATYKSDLFTSKMDLKLRKKLV
jgi:hypothetical protein